MKKGFKKYTKKHEHRFSLIKWIMIIFLLVITLIATGFFIYHYKKPVHLSGVLSNQVEKIEFWLTELKLRLQKKLGEVKEVVTNKPKNKPEIHFEFYTTLPTMQIKPQEGKKMASKKKIKLFDAERLEKALHNEIKKGER